MKDMWGKGGRGVLSESAGWKEMEVRTDYKGWDCKRGECAEGGQFFKPSDGYRIV